MVRSLGPCGSRCSLGVRVDDVPITHVTNGVHVPTWMQQPMRELLDRHLGAGWLARADDPRDVGWGRADPRRGDLGGPHGAPPPDDRRAPRAASPSTASVAAIRSTSRSRPSACSTATC